MSLRRVLSILCLMLLVLARPALAADSDLSPVKILPFSALMKLPKQQQVDYIRGVRAIMIDLQKVQKEAHRSASVRRRTNAQIVLLSSFIAKAEAFDIRDAIAAQGCPARIFDDPVRRAHKLSGAIFTCSKKSYVSKGDCLFGRRIGALRDDGRAVCVDQSHEDLAKYHKLRAQLTQPKPVVPALRVVKTQAAPTVLRNPAPSNLAAVEKPKAIAARNRVAVTNPPVKQASRKPSAATPSHPSDETPDTNAEPATPATPPSSTRRITSTPGNDAPDQPSTKDEEATLDSHEKGDSYLGGSDAEREALSKSMAANSKANIETADEATEDKFSKDIVALDKDVDGDMHYSRRKIANFKASTGDKQLDAVTSSDDLCKSAPVKPTCSTDKKDEGEKTLVEQKLRHCIAKGGMISHVDRDSRNNKQQILCADTSEFCLNSATCRKYGGEMVNGAQVLMRCKSNQIICSPYIFNVDSDGKPFCVSSSQSSEAVMEACGKLSDADPKRPAFVLNTSAPNGTIEGWNEFASEVNSLCFENQNQKGASDYFCEECGFLKERIWKLNAATLVSALPANKGVGKSPDLCYMMTSLEVNTSTHSIQRSTGQTK